MMKTLRISTVGLACVVVLIAAQSGEGQYLCPDKPLAFSDASFIGEAGGDRAGICVSLAGDMNGDGYEDILIGAYFNDEGGGNAGQSYLILGKPTSWSMDTPLSLSDASFIGEGHNDESGWSVSSAGDVNGDGYDDILIGAWANAEGGSGAGQTYLILGKPTGWSMDTPLSLSDASFIGEGHNDESGRSVSSAGDVNGDGYDDILIGAWHNDEGGGNAGQSYLILGKPTGWSMDTPLSLSDASFIGEASGDECGWSVSSAGDVNGDGYDDILIGAWANDEGGSGAGQTYLILGKPTGWSMDTPLSLSDASFIGEASGDFSGADLFLGGDVNGDGYDEILIGAWYNDEGGSDAGQTYLVLGKPTGWSMDTPLSLSDASFIGEASDDECGHCVSSAGDVDADGYDDILTGANHWPTGAGKVYLILGKPTGWSMDTPVSLSDASFIGEAGGYQAVGYGISLAGDVDADGYDDILLGAHHNDEGGSSAGQAYLNFGVEVGVFPELSVEVMPETTQVAPGERLWFCVDIENLTSSTVACQAWADGYLLNGNPYAGNPVKGPMRVRLSAYQVGHAWNCVKVPQGAPYGSPYTVCVRAGLHPEWAWAEDCFEFAILEPPIE